MKKKNRTIPQVELKALSGDSAVFCVDKTTLDCILTLWRVTLYNSTFILYGKEITELSTEELSQWHAMRSAILDDFERGINMGCDITAVLNRIASAVESLSSATVASNRISVNCCAGGGSGGSNNSGVGDSEPIEPPETPQEQTALCAGVRYIQHIAQAWIQRYLAPLAGLTAEQITVAVLASFAVPPYGDELPAIAVGLVAGIASVGVASLVAWLSDLTPAIADELYCRLVGNDYPGEGVAGWLADVIADVIAADSSACCGVADWVVQKVFNVSGATAKLTDLCAGQLDAIGAYNDEPCTCEDEDEGLYTFTLRGEHSMSFEYNSSRCSYGTETWNATRRMADNTTSYRGVDCAYDVIRLNNQPENANHVEIQFHWLCAGDGIIWPKQGENFLDPNFNTGYFSHDCNAVISRDIEPNVPVDLFIASTTLITLPDTDGRAFYWIIDNVIWSVR